MPEILDRGYFSDVHMQANRSPRKRRDSSREHRLELRAVRPPALSVLLIALSLSACAGNGASRNINVSLPPGDLVRIVEQEKGAPSNSHPVQLPASELSKALGSIRIRTKQVDLEQPEGLQLFTDDDLKGASVALQEAFSSASPREDIALRLAQLRSSDVITLLRASHITAARMFYLDDRLHIILGAVDEKPSRSFATVGTPTPKINYSSSDSARFFEDEIGSRKQVTTVERMFQLPDGMQFHSEQRRDWIEIDMQKFFAAHTPSLVTPTGEVSAQETISPPAKAHTLEARLRALRDLHDQGLISDELYKEKTRELVDSYIAE